MIIKTLGNREEGTLQILKEIILIKILKTSKLMSTGVCFGHFNRRGPQNEQVTITNLILDGPSRGERLHWLITSTSKRELPVL